jgi:uncharacterized membrane protein HdeD (DUF308 family)
MLQFISRNWWMLVLRGVCAILFGVLAFTWPGVTLGALILLWGAYAFADGVLALAAAFSGAASAPWWVLIVEGLVGIAAAVAAFFAPGITAILLLYLIAAWAVVKGVFQIVAAIQLRKEIEGEFWLGLAGLASLLFGLALFAQPGVGALAVVWIIGAYAMAFGALLVALGFRVRSPNRQLA